MESGRGSVLHFLGFPPTLASAAVQSKVGNSSGGGLLGLSGGLDSDKDDAEGMRLPGTGAVGIAEVGAVVVVVVDDAVASLEPGSSSSLTQTIGIGASKSTTSHQHESDHIQAKLVGEILRGTHTPVLPAAQTTPQIRFSLKEAPDF